jgi:hypothetical protein
MKIPRIMTAAQIPILLIVLMETSLKKMAAPVYGRNDSTLTLQQSADQWARRPDRSLHKGLRVQCPGNPPRPEAKGEEK